MKTFEIRRGSKKIVGIQESKDVVCFSAPCTVYPECVVEVRVTLAQAEELAGPNRRNVPTVLPDLAKELREIFVSGTTPAEWDELFSSSIKPLSNYKGYRVYKS